MRAALPAGVHESIERRSDPSRRSARARLAIAVARRRTELDADVACRFECARVRSRLVVRMRSRSRCAMKSAEATLTQAAKPHADRGRIMGLLVLSLIVVFVAAWMQVKGRSAVHKRIAPALNPNIEPSRFDANAWRLPADELLGFVAIPAGTFVMGSDPAL